MKKEEQLLNDLTELIKETQKNKVDWKVDCQTTEYNDLQEKPVHEEDGERWIVDECFVSYECTHKGKIYNMLSIRRKRFFIDHIRTDFYLRSKEEELQFIIYATDGNSFL